MDRDDGSSSVAAFQNHMLMERFAMVVDFLDNKLGPKKWRQNNEVAAPQQLIEALRDGVALCGLVGIKPRTELEEGTAQAAATRNIEAFLAMCVKMNVSSNNLFSARDLNDASGLSCMCVVNCLQEVRVKLVELDRAMLNEHFCSPQPAHKTLSRLKIDEGLGGKGNKAGGSPGSGLVRHGSASSMGSGRVKLLGRSGSSGNVLGSASDTPSKGLFDLLNAAGSTNNTPTQGIDQTDSPMTTPRMLRERESVIPATPPTPPSAMTFPEEGADGMSSLAEGSLLTMSGRSSKSRRVSITTLNTQASLAKVHERMLASLKERNKQLETGNKELMETCDDLQAAIGELQRSKHEYQKDCENLQERNRTLLSSFRVMEAQIMACTDTFESLPREELLKLAGSSSFEEAIQALREMWSDISTAQEVQESLSVTAAEEAEANAAAQAFGGQSESLNVPETISECDGENSDATALEEEMTDSDEEGAANAVLAAARAKAHDAAIEKLEAELELTKAELAAKAAMVDELQVELDEEREEWAAKGAGLRGELDKLKFEYADLSNDLRAQLSQSATGFSALAKDLSTKIGESEVARAQLQTRFERENARRKQLLNDVHNLRGNIRVMCRVRPVLQSDLAKDDANVAVQPLTDERLSISTERKSATGKGSTFKTDDFEFDRVFGSTSSQVHVFDEVQPLVESVMDGFHSCIFAYGQTGSGKTYTMSGSDTDRGINFLALDELFSIHEQRAAATGTSYTFKVRNVEIYCEKIIDLLSEQTSATGRQDTEENSGPAYLDIKFNDRDGVTMPGCVQVPVANAQEVREVMELGAQNRTQAHTKMNMESSRSHSVVMISVRGENLELGTVTLGQLVLVDLAGSERLAKSGVQGVQLKEAQSINKSLSCLGDVIAALESKSSHVPFRNSKLTTLLQDSLGKDNKALMVLQVSPTTYNAQESLCSLKFAQRVRSCELGRAKKREGNGDSLKSRAAKRAADERIASLELEGRRLKKQLESAEQAAADAASAAAAEAAFAAEKLTKRHEEKVGGMVRNFEMETKALRDKLAIRDRGDSGKVARLEDNLHRSKQEISELRQQLRNAMSSAGTMASSSTYSGSTLPVSPKLSTKSRRRSVAGGVSHHLPKVTFKRPPTVAETIATAAASPKRKPAVPSTYVKPTRSKATANSVPFKSASGAVLQERRSSLDNIDLSKGPTTPETAVKTSKQVSWKNTPQVIPPSEEKCLGAVRSASQDEMLQQDQVENHAPPAISAKHRTGSSLAASSVSAGARKSRMGGAARVLQTPGKKPSTSRSTARRIPAANKPRPGWQ